MGRPGLPQTTLQSLVAALAQVEDQSQTNSCCANAVAGAYEYINKRYAMSKGGILFFSGKVVFVNWGRFFPFFSHLLPFLVGERFFLLGRHHFLGAGGGFQSHVFVNMHPETSGRVADWTYIFSEMDVSNTT